jgi:hypothetical protein
LNRTPYGANAKLSGVPNQPSAGGCLCGGVRFELTEPPHQGRLLPDDPSQMSVRMDAYAAPWEPIPDDGLERFEEGKPRS